MTKEQENGIKWRWFTLGIWPVLGTPFFVTLCSGVANDKRTGNPASKAGSLPRVRQFRRRAGEVRRDIEKGDTMKIGFFVAVVLAMVCAALAAVRIASDQQVSAWGAFMAWANVAILQFMNAWKEN